MADAVGAADEKRTRGLIDTERLSAWMDEQDLPGRGEPLTTRFLSGGASNEIFEIRRGEHLAVLRRPPRDLPAGREETMLREYRVLHALNGTDVPHPEAIAVCEDRSVLGAVFYLMGYVDGWTPGPAGYEPPFDNDLEARRGLAFQLVDAIAKLSRVDWKARGLEGFGRPEGFHERQVERWLAHLAKFQFRELPGIDVASQWLRTHRPRVYEPGILHGDYSFANVLFHHGAPARMAAMVDWELATIGDPLLDLGWVIMGWPDPGEEESSKVFIQIDYTGMPTNAELLDYYARESGRAVDDIDYYVILARFKMAIVLEGGYARYVKGTADNPLMEIFGRLVLSMAANAAELAASTRLQ
jgi:aminoglycoside phosphotransferase (APT) family kinase protein